MKNDHLHEVKQIAPKPEPVKTGDLERALDNIHEKYGNDFQAFFRDVRESIRKNENAHTERSEVCA